MTVLSCDSNILHAYVYNNIIGHRHNRERGAAPVSVSGLYNVDCTSKDISGLLQPFWPSTDKDIMISLYS